MGQGYSQAVVIAGGFGAAWQPDVDPDSGRLELANLDRLPAREVSVSALADGPYLRQGGTSDAHVRLLADVAGDEQLPPILVQEDGWRVIDGAHRLAAARLRGDRSIWARFVDCTDAEALVLAMKANAAHGLPLSRADRVAGARRVLAAHPDWSDRALAGITGLSAKTIASLRTTGPALAPEPGGKRLGKDGLRRPVSAADGRRRAADYLAAHPDAPLRQVARETDVSLGTVHDVSARLRQGISPDRNGHRQPAPRLALRPAPAPRPTDTPANPFAAPPASPSAVPLAAPPIGPSTRPLATQPANPSSRPLAAPPASPSAATRRRRRAPPRCAGATTPTQPPTGPRSPRSSPTTRPSAIPKAARTSCAGWPCTPPTRPAGGSLPPPSRRTGTPSWPPSPRPSPPNGHNSPTSSKRATRPRSNGVIRVAATFK